MRPASIFVFFEVALVLVPRREPKLNSLKQGFSGLGFTKSMLRVPYFICTIKEPKTLC